MSGEQRTNINPHCKKNESNFRLQNVTYETRLFICMPNVLLLMHCWKKMSEIFLLNNHCQQPPVKLIIIMDKPSE